MITMRKSFVAVLLPLFFTGCLAIPEQVVPVSDFQLQNYLGRWYEIARLDHSFERGLSNITADYQLRADGGINVINCGFSASKDKWSKAQGKAYPVDSASVGHLRVSFFGPFYGSYIIFGLDQIDYQYAYISGPSKDFLWFLSRTPTVSDESYQKFVMQAAALGFDTSQLIKVNQSGQHCPSKAD